MYTSLNRKNAPKTKYRATIYLHQKLGDRQIYFRRVYRFEWMAILVLMLAPHPFTEFIKAGYINLEYQIEEIR